MTNLVRKHSLKRKSVVYANVCHPHEVRIHIPLSG